MGDGDESPPIHKAKLDDEFLKHPQSGAQIRNPFREKGRTLPILFSRGEYDHNALDEALHEWQMVTISETGFRDMVNSWSQHHGGAAILPTPAEIESKQSVGRSWRSPATWCKTRQRAALGKLKDSTNGFEFSVHLRKSSYSGVRTERRTRGKEGGHKSMLLDKVGLEVSDDKGLYLRVDAVHEGLVVQWNRAHPSFVVKPGDIIVKVNDRHNSSAAMIEELHSSHETWRLTVRRAEINPKQIKRRSSNIDSGMGRQMSGESGSPKLPTPRVNRQATFQR
jgi:hypothetical protein